MGFEKYTGKWAIIKDQASISILKGGQFGINQACHRKYFKDYKCAFFYYDKETEKIGIQPTNEETKDSYPIRLSRGGNLANISAISFLKYFKIDYRVTKAYPVTWNDDEKLVEINLNQ